jgi:fermentation-respiration switch protein FrsA (DUF1100 family)
MPGEEPFAYYGTGRGASACWENSVTRGSVRELLTVDNMSGADFLSPTPGWIVHGVQDAYCSPEGARLHDKDSQRPHKIDMCQVPGWPARRGAHPPQQAPSG